MNKARIFSYAIPVGLFLAFLFTSNISIEYEGKYENFNISYFLFKGPRNYEIKRFQAFGVKDNNLSEEKLDPQLMKMMKDSADVIFARAHTDLPFTDFVGKKTQNFSDVLDFRLGKY